jgi:hypothetical protein
MKIIFAMRAKPSASKPAGTAALVVLVAPDALVALVAGVAVSGVIDGRVDGFE